MLGSYMRNFNMGMLQNWDQRTLLRFEKYDSYVPILMKFPTILARWFFVLDVTRVEA